MSATDDPRTKRLYHGTRADFSSGDLIRPGHTPNYGDRGRTTPHVCLARTLDAATLGAELELQGVEPIDD